MLIKYDYEKFTVRDIPNKNFEEIVQYLQRHDLSS